MLVIPVRGAHAVTEVCASDQRYSPKIMDRYYIGGMVVAEFQAQLEEVQGGLVELVSPERVIGVLR